METKEQQKKGQLTDRIKQKSKEFWDILSEIIYLGYVDITLGYVDKTE